MQRGGQARGDYPPEGRKGGGPEILCQPNHTHWEQKAFMTIPIFYVKQLISDQITELNVQIQDIQVQLPSVYFDAYR